ncbi:MAG: hypothetical protein R3D26_18135 [Cyanobacteriota/Melainabacteria group bacterium]
MEIFFIDQMGFDRSLPTLMALSELAARVFSRALCEQRLASTIKSPSLKFSSSSI